jgi:hypothetical protein
MGMLSGLTGSKQDRCNQWTGNNAVKQTSIKKNYYIPPLVTDEHSIPRGPAGIHQVSLHMK